MKQRSTSRTFTKTGGTKPAKNSGIFSKSGAGQKMDSQPKPSYGSKAPENLTRKTIDADSVKVGMTKTTGSKSAGAVQKYALK